MHTLLVCLICYRIFLNFSSENALSQLCLCMLSIVCIDSGTLKLQTKVELDACIGLLALNLKAMSVFDGAGISVDLAERTAVTKEELRHVIKWPNDVKSMQLSVAASPTPRCAVLQLHDLASVSYQTVHCTRFEEIWKRSGKLYILHPKYSIELEHRVKTRDTLRETILWLELSVHTLGWSRWTHQTLGNPVWLGVAHFENYHNAVQPLISEWLETLVVCAVCFGIFANTSYTYCWYSTTFLQVAVVH